VSTRRCTRIDRAVRWVGIEIRGPTIFHGVNDLEEFLKRYEDEVLENHRLLSLDIALEQHLEYGGVCTKKKLRTSTNVSDYCALDSTQRRGEIRFKDMMDRGHQ
jgi:hypothetical protein